MYHYWFINCTFNKCAILVYVHNRGNQVGGIGEPSVLFYHFSVNILK